MWTWCAAPMRRWKQATSTRWRASSRATRCGRCRAGAPSRESIAAGRDPRRVPRSCWGRCPAGTLYAELLDVAVGEHYLVVIQRTSGVPEGTEPRRHQLPAGEDAPRTHRRGERALHRRPARRHRRLLGMTPPAVTLNALPATSVCAPLRGQTVSPSSRCARSMMSCTRPRCGPCVRWTSTRRPGHDQPHDGDGAGRVVGDANFLFCHTPRGRPVTHYSSRHGRRGDDSRVTTSLEGTLMILRARFAAVGLWCSVLGSRALWRPMRPNGALWSGDGQAPDRVEPGHRRRR